MIFETCICDPIPGEILGGWEFMSSGKLSTKSIPTI